MKIITKQVAREIISSYPDLNGRAMTYYLGTVTPGATRIDREIPSHISSYLCMHNLVPKGQKRPSTRPKASVCT